MGRLAGGPEQRGVTRARGWCGRWGLAVPDAVWLVSRGNGPCGEGDEAGLRGVREDRAQEREGAREQARLGRALWEWKWAERGLIGPGSWVELGLSWAGLGLVSISISSFFPFSNSNSNKV